MAVVSAPVTSAARMQRLLAMVPWIAAQDGPTLAEVCERFDLTEKQLAADLEVMWLVGLPPYTPDALIDVVQEGDRVWIHFADVFHAPQRLTPDQAVALLTAGASVLALPGTDTSGALARGVAKLAAVLGVDAQQVLDVDLGLGGAEILDVLRAGVSEHRRVHLDYYSYGRDARTERGVDPYLVHAEDGSLYLLGYCHLAHAERRFRVDRIAAARLLDDRFDPPDVATPSGVFQPDTDDPRVVLDLAPSAAWVAEAYPVEQVERRDDGSLRVHLAVAAEAWFERLLVGLGPQVTVVEAPPALEGAGRRASARILDRYR
jgi:proteasome accessory factor C